MPIVFKREGVRKFITYYEKRLREKVFDSRVEKKVSYKDIMEYQVRSLVKAIEEKRPYEGFFIK